MFESIIATDHTKGGTEEVMVFYQRDGRKWVGAFTSGETAAIWYKQLVEGCEPPVGEGDAYDAGDREATDKLLAAVHPADAFKPNRRNFLASWYQREDVACGPEGEKFLRTMDRFAN